LWTTIKPVVVPSGVSGGSGFVKNTGVTCFGCGRPGHIQKRCPYKTSKSTKKAVTVTAPILRVPKEGTLGAEKHLEAHLDKLLEGGGVKVTPLVGFRLLSHPLSHLGV
jgi:hypothetical protein